MSDLPWVNPTLYLDAWTAEKYEGNYPMYVNATQVGSMVELTFRAPAKADGSCGDTFVLPVNVWTVSKIADVLKSASNKFECGLSDRIFEAYMERVSPREKTCMNCGAYECDHSTAYRCGASGCSSEWEPNK